MMQDYDLKSRSLLTTMKTNRKTNIPIKTIISMLILLLNASGCDESDENNQYALSRLVPDPVTITLNGDIGLIVFKIEEESPNMPTEPAEELQNLLVQGIISVAVKNDNTSVTHSLTEAALITGSPIAPRQYAVHPSADGTSVTIEFFNAINGTKLQKEGNYSVAVTVQDNTYFGGETFIRNVSVN
jgi:hypothetical protein